MEYFKVWKFLLFLDQPPESYSQRVKPEFNKLSSEKVRSQLKNDIDSLMEEDDFMEFSDNINDVIEFHNNDANLRYLKCLITWIHQNNFL
jgi:hypothetical protein